MTGPLSSARRSLSAAAQRWRDQPLRTRLTTAAALAATLTIVAVVAVAYVAVRHELRAQIDHQLRRQVSEIHTDRPFDPFTGTGRFTIATGVGDIGGYAQVLNSRGQSVLGSDNLPINRGDVQVARNGGTMLRDIRYDGRHVRMLTTPLRRFPGNAVQIALPLGDVDH